MLFEPFRMPAVSADEAIFYENGFFEAATSRFISLANSPPGSVCPSGLSPFPSVHFQIHHTVFQRREAVDVAFHDIPVVDHDSTRGAGGNDISGKQGHDGGKK